MKKNKAPIVAKALFVSCCNECPFLSVFEKNGDRGQYCEITDETIPYTEGIDKQCPLRKEAIIVKIKECL